MTDYLNILRQTFRGNEMHIVKISNLIKKAKKEKKYINIWSGYLVKKDNELRYRYSDNNNYPICYKCSYVGSHYYKDVDKVLRFYMRLLEVYQRTKDTLCISDMMNWELKKNSLIVKKYLSGDLSEIDELRNYDGDSDYTCSDEESLNKELSDSDENLIFTNISNLESSSNSSFNSNIYGMDDENLLTNPFLTDSNCNDNEDD